MFQKERYSAVSPRLYKKPALRALALAGALLALSGASLAASPVNDEIARIENGLRPSVVLADAPVVTNKLADEMARLHVPGVSVAVIRNGQIAWARGFGVTQAGGAAVDARTLFQAASISKPVAAMAALKLVEGGQLALDADINSVLTSWKLPAATGVPATASLRQLLSHTAGTSVSGFPGYAAGKPVPTLLQVLDGAAPANTRPVRIDGPQGSFRYSGGGYSVVQQALIDRSGRSFDALLTDTVLKPLGMSDSSFAQPLPAALQTRAALPHDRRGQPYAGGPYTYPELAAAGLWTTPTDLARFALEVQRAASGKGKGVLSQASARTMLAVPGKDKGYALGLQVEGRGAAASFEHGGSNMGYQNTLFAYTEHGDGAVVLTNGDNGAELAQGLIRAIAAEYKWPTYQSKTRKAVPLDAARRAALPGRYVTREIGDFTIEERGGQLMIALRAGQFEPLYAESPEVLFVLSRDADLRMAPDGKSGRLVSGAFDIAFQRVE
ncbi:MAG: serine hydrolase domain-containing protein [Pseudomonadota bacterium]